MMARPQAQRHGLRCPDCGSNRRSKHGFNQGMQRYRCGDCGRRYQPGAARGGQGRGGELERGLHSVWRGRLNRLMRRTKGYTKSVAMLAYSLALVCWRGHCKVNLTLW